MSFEDLESGGYKGSNNDGGYGDWGRGNSSFGQGGYGQRSPFGSSSSSSSSSSAQAGDASRFPQLAQTVTNDVKQLAASVAQLKNLAKIVGTSRDSEQVRAKLRDTLHGTQSLARQANTDLKQLVNYSLEGSAAQQTKNRRVCDKLSKDFEKYLGEFREVARVAAEKERVALRKTKAASKNFGSGGNKEGETTGLLESARHQQQQQQQQHMMQIDSEVEFNQAMIQDREDELAEIESAMLELNEIFRDVGALVYDQGQQIDNIEHHIDESVAYTDEAVAELLDARESQKSARCKMCCFIILAILIVVVIIVAIVLGVKLG